MSMRLRAQLLAVIVAALFVASAVSVGISGVTDTSTDTFMPETSPADGAQARQFSMTFDAPP